MNHSIGLNGAHLVSVASLWDSENNAAGSENRVELYLDGAAAKEWFARLSDDRTAIEREVGQPLIWYDPDTAKMCRVFLRTAADIRDEARWPEQFEWLRTRVELLARVFGPRLRALAGGSESGLRASSA